MYSYYMPVSGSEHLCDYLIGDHFKVLTLS